MEDITIGLAFFAGLLSFVSPCVLPLVPAYVGYMGGRMTRNVALQTTGDGKVKTNGFVNVIARATLFGHGLAFVLGFTVVFVLIGLMTTAFVSVVGSSVNTLTDIIGRIGGVIIIFFGLHFMGAINRTFTRLKQNPTLISSPLTSLLILITGTVLILWGFKALDFTPNFSFNENNVVFALPFLASFILWMILGASLTRPAAFWLNVIRSIENLLYSDTRADMQVQPNQGLVGSFLMGVVFSAGWTPCIGPLLGTILTIAANTGDVGVAVPLLTAYSLGLGIPFLVAALLMDSAQSIIRRLQRHMRLIETVSGSLLVVIGILVASGQLTVLSQNLNNQFADFSYRMEECGIGFVRGDIGGQYLGPCLAGNLHPATLNQALLGNFDADTRQMAYLFKMETPGAIDVELSRFDFTQAPSVTLNDSHNNLIVTAQEFTMRDDENALLIAGLELPVGTYQLTLSAPPQEEGRYRLRIRPASTTTQTNDDAQEDSALNSLALEGLSTIDALAELSEPVEGLSLGNRAPDFSVTTLGGEPLQLADLRGQVVILNFWGTWCGPCRREMPELQQLYETYSQDSLTILALAVRDTNQAIAEFRDEFGLTFTLALDVNEDITRQYGIIGQPTTFILDANGVIIHQSFSIITKDEIEAVIQDVLPQA